VLDPDLYKVGPQQVKRFASEYNAFMTAGFDPALLQDGPVEAIVERIKLYIDKLARDERCMIHLNQIPVSTPSEHVHTAVAACHAYGQLPVQESLNEIQFDLPERESFAEFIEQSKEF